MKNRTKLEKSAMTDDKINSKRTVDRLISEELLKMGFSYSHIGTHYLHDSIAQSVSMKLEDFYSAYALCTKISNMVCKKYNAQCSAYCKGIDRAIETAFQVGNIDYILETFKESYDQDNMRIYKNAFIMTMRKKILSQLEELEEKKSHNAAQLRIIIQGELEGISDILALEGIKNIIFSLKGEKFAVG